MPDIQHLTQALAARYRIERELGMGGMATVYLAHDVRHDRPVALKVLRPEVAESLGAERFLREIRITARLDHPHILTLIDSGESDGQLWYVVPYIRGESLRAWLDREIQLSVEDALSVARQVAAALDYAHRQGVIHRDVKPENILLHEGEAMLADFGIAVALEEAGGPRLTTRGIYVGTPQYMSPEQATGGGRLDARSDVYSLGAVVYEMLAGEPPHTGPTATAVIARLLTEKPVRLRSRRDTVDEGVDDAVQKALARVPADRFASAASFAEALQKKEKVPRPPARQLLARRSTWLVGGAALVATVVALVAVKGWPRSRSATEAPVTPTRYPLAFTGDAKYASGGGVRVALSGDGTQLAYVGGGAVPRLYLKKLTDIEPQPIPGTQGALDPQFSPDGSWIAFRVGAPSTLMKIPVTGGVAVPIADSVHRYSWGDNDVVVVSRNSPATAATLWLTNSSGDRDELLAKPESAQGVNYDFPHLLPGGESALFTIGGRDGPSEVAVIRISDGSILRLGVYGSNPRYLSTGHILYARTDGTVMAAPFDLRRPRVTGIAVPMLKDVVVRPDGVMQLSVARDGTLLYVPEGVGSQLVLSDRTGHVRVVLPDTLRRATWPRFSPDGKRIAFQRGAVPYDGNLWVYDITSTTLTQLTSDNRSFGPSWSVDGRHLSWSVYLPTGRARIVWQPWDASEAPVTLVDSAWDGDLSRSGRSMIGRSGLGPRGWFMMMLDSARRRMPLEFEAVGLARISPDGKWIAYAARGSESEPTEVYVQATLGPGGRRKISANGGSAPVWSATGGELFYRTRGWLWSATITTSPAFAVVRRDSLFAMHVSALNGYDASPDAKSFVMPWLVGEENQPPVLVTGWFTELRERLAGAPGTAPGTT